MQPGLRIIALAKGGKTLFAFFLWKVEMSTPTEKDFWSPSTSFSNVMRPVGLLTIEGETCSLEGMVLVQLLESEQLIDT